MIKFFRKIRQSLLAKNKFSNYLIYAIGEIVLVIIGILLALQINNWNESKKIETDLINSLRSMVGEINENLKFIRQEQKSIKSRADGVQKILDGTASMEQQKNVLNIFGQDANSNPFKKVYELLKNEKKLRLIKDDELVKEINRFYEYNLVSLDNFCKWHEGFVGNNIDPYILENIPMDNFKIELKTLDNLRKQVKFRNILAYQKLLYLSYVQASTNTIKNGEKLVNQLEIYLKDHD